MKLNLVPDYVRQRKVNKQIVALMVVLFVVVNAAMVFWMLQTNRRLAELQEEKSTLEMQAQQVDSLVQQAQGKISQAAITLAKSEFVKMVQRQNLRYPELYSEVARYTAPRVRYVQLQVAQGNQLQVTAFAKGPKEIGLYLQTMYQCPLFSAVNLTTQTPGYATGGGGATGALPGLGLGFGGGVPPGPMVGGLAGAAGGAPSPPAFSPSPGLGAGGAAGQGASPAGLMQFQVVAILKEPITPLQPPAQLNIGGGTGGLGGGGFGGGGFGGGFGAGPAPGPVVGPGGRGGGIGL
jgi:Tfp pilus assembly protein PilN